MQTVKPKSNRRKILAVIVIVAVLVGGIASYFIFFRSSTGGGQSGFGITVYVGDPNSGKNTWTRISPTPPDRLPTTLLNGTSLGLVVEANATGGFSDFVQLRLVNSTGVVSSFARTTLRPQSGGTSVTGLTLTAPANTPTRELPYNFTVIGTSGSVTHNATFPLRIRATTVSLAPSFTRVPIGNSTSVFTVRVETTDVYEVNGFQLTLGFNSSIVKAVNTTFAPIFNDPRTGFVVSPVIDNVAGTVQIAGVVLAGACPGDFCVNSPAPRVYNLANVTFINSTLTGSTSLKLSGVVLTEAFVGTAFPIPTPNLLSGSATVDQRRTTTSLACIPSTLGHGTNTTCTSTVGDLVGAFIIPTGTVSFTTTNSTGTFSLGMCTLTPSSPSAVCSLKFTEQSPGIQIVTATYAGDREHTSSVSSQVSVDFN